MFSNINSMKHIGKTAIFNGSMVLYHGMNLLRLVANDNTNSRFLYYELTTIKHRNWVRIHANPAVNQASINQHELSLEPMYVTNTNEQAKISRLILQTDTIFDLQQRRLKQIKQLKKAMLQQLFADQRKAQPITRFNNFDSNWVPHKFKDYVTRISNHDSNPQLPHIEFENINSGEGTLNIGLDKLTSNKTGIKFQKNDILFGKLRPYLKNWYLAQQSGIAVGDFWVLRPKSSSLFFYYLIQTNRFYSISNLTSGSKMPRSDWNMVSNYKFKIPSNINEGNRIGYFISLLDKIIIFQQFKLKQLNSCKEFLLQKLFI